MAEWQHAFCGCFDNIGICIIAYFIPCYTMGKNAEAMGESCLLHGLLGFVPILHFVCPSIIREKVRKQKGIEGNLVEDLLLTMCCTICSLVQVAQELEQNSAAMAMNGGEEMTRA